MAYAYTNTGGVTYYLHQGTVTLAGNTAPRPHFYFSKTIGVGAIDAVPEGYEVFEGPRSALPLLRKQAPAEGAN